MACDITGAGSEERGMVEGWGEGGRGEIGLPGLCAVMSVEKHSGRPTGGVRAGQVGNCIPSFQISLPPG